MFFLEGIKYITITKQTMNSFQLFAKSSTFKLKGFVSNGKQPITFFKIFKYGVISKVICALFSY